MANRSLNDEEVYAEMKKMVAFIKQEALEKAREIKVKADEEFSMEKAKIVRQESIAIEANFDKKLKQVEIQKRITQSTLTNKARLDILATRQTKVDEIFEIASQALLKLQDDKEKYHKLLVEYILQGFYSLMEKKVTVQCRQKDEAEVQAAAKEASDLFEKEIGYPVEVVIDSAYLKESAAGGVVLSCLDGKIRVHNTLESRLDMLKEQMLPQIRYNLFGPSPSRKFYN
ncbi:ATPase, V1/A1 complex, subunit E [Conidiobolus coronatus NRRL 28638]|uniref:ATPase, V1/A1 complex, subunit E n=1 Tax=Conidiobolus coronatus (strain ATCC 28846 / CBS 209.66 / NRRL 28638) TaxID=796925 RepID=A0A137PI59_CONC2|nr:ATPase, V1/A1 complex, subunit E [Conidiobolus coronatus NRRL 28638]|eukprot:KXN74665.1 ATPase, V1/A1 complex, subunit E [Conidiobolus coronatus NRRL 28638]